MWLGGYVSEAPKATATPAAMDLDDMLDEVGGDSPTVQADASNGSKLVQKRGDVVLLDDDHPFDLESYISNYTGAVKVYLSSIDFNDPLSRSNDYISFDPYCKSVSNSCSNGTAIRDTGYPSNI